MRPQAKLRVNLFTQVSPDIDKRRRRLQEKLGLTVPELIDRALRSLESQLQAEHDMPGTA
jgi:hypothetical protein